MSLWQTSILSNVFSFMLYCDINYSYFSVWDISDDDDDQVQSNNGPFIAIAFILLRASLHRFAPLCSLKPPSYPRCPIAIGVGEQWALCSHPHKDVMLMTCIRFLTSVRPLRGCRCTLGGSTVEGGWEGWIRQSPVFGGGWFRGGSCSQHSGLALCEAWTKTAKRHNISSHSSYYIIHYFNPQFVLELLIHFPAPPGCYSWFYCMYSCSSAATLYCSL